MANLALANVMHRKTRTAVSVLAVGMEAAMVMVLVGLATGTIDDIASRLQNVGADVLFQPPDSSLILGASHAVMPIDLQDEIRLASGVKDVSPVLNAFVSKLKAARALNLWAVDRVSFTRLSGGFRLVDGRGLEQPGDLVVDSVFAQVAGVHVGEQLEILDRPFRVAGIFRAGAGGRLFARIEDVQQAIDEPGKASFFLVKATQAQEADAVVLALQQRFPGYRITPMSQVSRRMQDNVVGLRQFKEALTALAVVISFLVVSLAMYTTILERTREIGILRAIGATQAAVVRIVVTESCWICASGVVLGVLLAVAASWGLPRIFPTLHVALSGEWALIASGLGLAGGLMGSVYPALKAARLDPVQALNFE